MNKKHEKKNNCLSFMFNNANKLTSSIEEENIFHSIKQSKNVCIAILVISG